MFTTVVMSRLEHFILVVCTKESYDIVVLPDVVDTEEALAEERGTALHALWMVIASSWAMFTMFMQLGLALVESNSVREKSY